VDMYVCESCSFETLEEAEAHETAHLIRLRKQRLVKNSAVSFPRVETANRGKHDFHRSLVSRVAVWLRCPKSTGKWEEMCSDIKKKVCITQNSD
jgi:hypothetical protein